jgi:phage N-6-adenine-methyltransferase
MDQKKAKAKLEDEGPGDHWQTPAWVWAPWFDRFHVELDAAASAENTLVDIVGGSKPRAGFISEKVDALSFEWTKLKLSPGAAIWVNPPYSQKAGPLKRWVEKFEHEAHEHGYRVIALLPADTSTQWFSYCLALDRDRRALLHYLPRRVRHVDPRTGELGGSPKFGSVIVYFDSRIGNPYTALAL